MTESHIAGPAVTWDGRYMRQRCAWCGAILLDYDLTRLASMDGAPPAMWPEYETIRQDGPMSMIVDLESSSGDDGLKAPADSCLRLDPAVTA